MDEQRRLATEEALALWIANRRLRNGLDEIYAQNPDARPTDEQITAAERALERS